VSLDVLTVGGIAFTDFSPPDRMMGGGNQAMVIHKLPGGSRVIDTLGPDEAAVVFSGEFFGNNAYGMALSLDAIRAQGNVVELQWGGQFRQVIVRNFIYHVKRLPVWVEYTITLEVQSNPQQGPLGSIASTVDQLVTTDLATALSL
jgi:hypothetical protein